jgi:hypothetical protein
LQEKKIEKTKIFFGTIFAVRQNTKRKSLCCKYLHQKCGQIFAVTPYDTRIYGWLAVIICKPAGSAGTNV